MKVVIRRLAFAALRPLLGRQDTHVVILDDDLADDPEFVHDVAEAVRRSYARRGTS